MDVNNNIEDQIETLRAQMTHGTVAKMKTSKIVALLSAFAYKTIRLEEVGGTDGVEKSLRGQVEQLVKGGALDEDGADDVLSKALEGVSQVLQLTAKYLPMLEDELDRRVPTPRDGEDTLNDKPVS